MNAIQPGQLIVSVFGLQASHKTSHLSALFNLIGAFFIVLACAAILGFAVSRLGAINLSFSTTSESAAYLPSQAISSQLTQGYLNLR